MSGEHNSGRVTGSGPAAFDPSELLPPGRIVVEASAGSGKTYAIASAVVRHLIESEHTIERVAVMTFTRAAARELRARIRSRLDEARAVLAGECPVPDGDPLLAEVIRQDRPNRLQQIEAAIAHFEAASISTIHAFAQGCLVALGAQASTIDDSDPDGVSSGAIRRAVADALAIASIEVPSDVPLPRAEQVRSLVTRIVNSPGIRVETSSAEPTPADHLRRAVVDSALQRLRQEAGGGALGSYTDRVLLLRDLLRENPGRAAQLGARFDLVLVDEFQDTDLVQWEILSLLFAPERTALVLVGDPKQAIYAFRGADVHAYLRAVGDASNRQATLGVNWRADGALVGGLNRLYAGVNFGERAIAYHPVVACEPNAARRALSPDGNAPAMRIRVVDANGETLSTEQAAELICEDLALHARKLIDEVRIPDGRGLLRPVLPRDIAVLVSAQRHLHAIERALSRAGIASVRLRATSVFHSEAYRHWRVLLDALAHLHDPRRTRAVALTWFFSDDLDALEAEDGEVLRELSLCLERWAIELEVNGTGAFLRRVFAESQVGARLLSLQGGERELTDLHHIGSLLAGARVFGPSSASGLRRVLGQLAERGSEGDEDAAFARRVDSSRDAVQLLTVHGAKGLEFPFVLAPMLWRAGNAAIEHVFEDPEFGRTIDCAFGRATKALAEHEIAGESLRLAYVATTRARHQLALWFFGSKASGRLGLSRVLLARGDDGRIDPELFAMPRVPTVEPAVIRSRLAAAFGPLAEGPDAVVDLSLLRKTGSLELPVPEPQRAAPTEALGLALSTRAFDRSARRWSFSAIAEQLEAGASRTFDPVDETLGDAGAGDEPPDDDTSLGADGSSELPLGALGGGVAFGTFVHSVLEEADFAAPDLDVEIGRAVSACAGRLGGAYERRGLVAGLRAMIETPLGGPLAGLRLSDIVRRDRLDELRFELCLASGDEAATLEAIGETCARWLSPDDPLAEWAKLLASPSGALRLAGHLTGSIDLVFRAPSTDRDARFVIADYKTNLLGVPGRPLRLSDYRPEVLPRAMIEHDYPLQALLYAVALHRFLRWRLAGYEPHRHLGGVVYLFVRGMIGPGTPMDATSSYGVFHWQPPAELVVETSTILAGGER